MQHIDVFERNVNPKQTEKDLTSFQILFHRSGNGFLGLPSNYVDRMQVMHELTPTDLKYDQKSAKNMNYSKMGYFLIKYFPLDLVWDQKFESIPIYYIWTIFYAYFWQLGDTLVHENFILTISIPK